MIFSPINTIQIYRIIEKYVKYYLYFVFLFGLSLEKVYLCSSYSLEKVF